MRVGSKAWEDFCVDNNLLGKEAEKSGDLDEAIQLYESVVDAKFDGSFPYDRLCTIYRKQGLYQKEYEVLKKAISVFSKNAKTTHRTDIYSKLEKFKERREKLLQLTSKKGVNIDI